MKEIKILMEDDKLVSFAENRHAMEFNGEWLIIKTGYDYSQVVFAASARKIKYIRVS